jgi:hypothetical protein
VYRERFENTVKISSPPAETVALLVPHDRGNEQNINSIKALGPKILQLGLGNIETSRRELFPKILDLREEEVNVSLLYNGDKNSLVAIQGLSNQRTSINFTVFADIAGNTSRADVFVKMQNLICDLHALLFNVSSRLSISEA